MHAAQGVGENIKKAYKENGPYKIWCLMLISEKIIYIH